MSNNRFNTRNILLILILICVSYFIYSFYGPYVHFPKERHVFEKGIEYPSIHYVVEYNGEVTPESKYLDTKETGLHEFHYSVKKGIFTKDVVFYYEVVDTTAPIIEIANENINIDPDTVYSYDDVLKNVSINEGTITYNTKLDTRYAGTYTIDITATDEHNNSSYASYTVTVNDYEPPFVLESGEGTIIKRWSAFDVNDVLSYGDNVDDSLELELQGFVNTSYIGKYPIQATLTDDSGNTTSWSFTVEVVRNIQEEEEDDITYAFEDFIKDYKIDGRKVGIDVSEWQNEIDFEKVKEAGCEFVMMRIGFSHDGILTLDKEFRNNFDKAKKAGLPVGIYYYSYDTSTEEVSSVLDQIFEELDGATLELPIVFDWENFNNYQDYNMSFKTLNDLYEEFEKKVSENGYEAMLYGSRYYLNNIWRDVEDKPIWLAHYTYWSNYDKPYVMWQRCAWGQIDGIETDCDFDVLFEDIDN